MSNIRDLDCLSQVELALLWGCSTRTIQRKPECEPLRHGFGQGCYYVWSECRAFEKRQMSQDSSDQPNNDRARKLKAEADMAEMEAAKMAGGLVDAKEAQREMEEALARLKSNLMGFPDRIVPQFEEGGTLAEKLAICRKEMHATLRDIVAKESQP